MGRRLRRPSQAQRNGFSRGLTINLPLKDVTLGEDHSQVRSGYAPQVLAALNNTVLALMDFLHVPNVPALMRF